MDAKNLYEGISSLLAVSSTSRELPKPLTTKEEKSESISENGDLPEEENGIMPEPEQAQNGQVDEDNNLIPLTERPANEWINGTTHRSNSPFCYCSRSLQIFGMLFVIITPKRWSCKVSH